MLRYLVFFLVSIFCLAKSDDSSVELSLLTTADEDFKALDNFFQDRFYLEKIVFHCDVVMHEYEFNNLSNLYNNTWVTADQIKRACWHLKRKNKFDTLTITKNTDSNSCGQVVIFDLKSLWTFSKVIFKSSLMDKDRYQQYYLLETGEPFDLANHQHSIVNILNELRQQGYLNAKVCDYISYDKETKSVTVTICLEQVNRFVIDNVKVNIKIHETEMTEDSKNLQTKIQAMVNRELSGNYYSKSLVTQQIKQIKKYLAHKGFVNPKIELSNNIDNKKNHISLEYDITLYQKKRFIFFGNHFFSSDQLLNELLVVDTSALLIPPSLLAEDIKGLYKKKGFWRVSVDWKEEPDRFFFVINEGFRVGITNITLKGEVPADASELLQNYLSDFYKFSYFDAEILNTGLDKFCNYYINQGFWDFNIIKQEFTQLNENSNNSVLYELILTLNCGEQRLLTNVTIEGFPELLPELLKEEPFASLKKLKMPCPFNVNMVQEYRQWLIKYFRRKGFIYVVVKPELVYNSQGIELKWHIDHNIGQVKFGKTIITGSSRIPSNVILRELQYKEGDLWDKEKIEQSLKRLKSLNIFESVSLVPYNLPSAENNKTMILKFIEDDPFEIRTRLGFQQISKSFTNLAGTTYILGGSFLWRNPRFIGDNIRIDADITRYTRNFAASYELPWLLNRPIRTLFKIYSDHYNQPFFVKHNCLYTESHDGLLVNFAPYSNNFKMTLTVGFEFSKLSRLSTHLAEVIDFQPQLVNQRIPIVFIEPSFIYESFDNKLNPTKGLFTFISAKGIFPLTIKNSQFIKLLFEQAFVYPLYKYVIGAMRFRFGHIFNTQFSSILPTERFYLGGASSLRGYEPDMVPPLNVFKNCNNQSTQECWVPIGGRSMVNVNAEARFPIYKNVSGVLFNDMGILIQNNISDIAGNKWVGATGLGLRYDTPIGPIRFDIGWKWKKRHENDKPYAWFLSLGHSF